MQSESPKTVQRRGVSLVASRSPMKRSLAPNKTRPAGAGVPSGYKAKHEASDHW